MSLLYSRFVKLNAFSLLYGEGTLGAFANASAQAVTITLADQLGFAIHYLDGPFGAGERAVPTSVAFLFVYLDDFSDYFSRHYDLLCFGIALSPFNSCQRCSPRQRRAEAHQSIQEGSLSLYTMLPQL
jgi:hypothetical protein